MARLIGPDEACRTVFLTTGTNAGKAKAQGMSVPLYSDPALTVSADVLSTTDGVIAGTPPTLTVDAYSQIPLFKYPDGVEVVYTSINGGPSVPLYARTDERLDALVAAVAELQEGGGGGGAVSSVAGRTGAVTLDAADVAGVETPAGAQAKATAAAAASVPLTSVGQASGVASLDGAGKLPTAQIPAIAISSYLGTVVNQAAMLALTGQEGDWAVRSDLGTTWMITGSDPTVLGSWTQIATPTDAVASVAGKTGAVTLTAADVNAAGLNYNYLGPFAASTVYALGDLVTAPSGDVVTPKVAFTSGTNYSAANWNTVTNAGALTRSQMRGNRVSMLGDSLSVGVLSPTASLYLRLGDPLSWACFYTDSKAQYQVSAGVSGNTTTHMLARVDTDVIAYGAEWCVIMGGTNDSAAGATTAQYASNIRAIVAKLIAANIRPVLVTPPPKTVGMNGVTSAARQQLEAYVAWLRYYCAKVGIPLVDGFATLIDPATGNLKTAYGSGDGVHFSALGQRVLGEAIAATINPLLNSVLPELAMHQNADSRNLLPNGLFLDDTNADGLADGWTMHGATAVASLVTGDSSIKGNWQRLTNTTAESAQIFAGFYDGFAVGDRLAFSAMVKSASTDGIMWIGLTFNASSAEVGPMRNISVPFDAHRLYLEYVVPPGTTGISVNLAAANGTAIDVQIAQVTLVNLTALGVDTA